MREFIHPQSPHEMKDISVFISPTTDNFLWSSESISLHSVHEKTDSMFKTSLIRKRNWVCFLAWSTNVLRNIWLVLYFTPAWKNDVDCVIQHHLRFEMLRLQRLRLCCTVSDHKKRKRPYRLERRFCVGQRKPKTYKKGIVFTSKAK